MLSNKSGLSHFSTLLVLVAVSFLVIYTKTHADHNTTFEIVSKHAPKTLIPSAWGNCNSFLWLKEDNCAVNCTCNYTRVEKFINTPVCNINGNNICLPSYSPNYIQKWLYRMKTKLQSKPQIVFIGESVMRGWANLLVRWLTGSFAYDFLGKNSGTKHGYWRWESDFGVICFYFIGGFYSVEDGAERYTDLVKKYHSIENFLSLAVNASDESLPHQQGPTIAYIVGGGIWDLLFLKNKTSMFNVTSAHSHNLISLLSSSEQYAEKTQMIQPLKFFRDIPACDRLSNDAVTAFNKQLSASAENAGIYLIPAYNTSVNHPIGTHDGLHFHCDTEEACIKNPELQEVHWVWTQFLFDTLLTRIPN